MIGERARALNPTIPRLYGVIADAQIELGMYDEAVQTLQTMIDMRPDLGSYSRAAYLRELFGDPQGAVELMAMAVRAGSRRDPEPLAWCLVQLGNLHFNQSHLREAEAAYRKALAVFPNYYQALAALGRVRGAQQRYPEAIELYQQAMAIVPAPDTVAALGDVLAITGKPDEAEKQYALVEYIEHVNEINQTTYNRQLALFNADHDRKLDEAVKLAETELERRKDIYTYDTLAWVYYKTKRFTDAWRMMEHALRLETKDASLFFHAGMIAHRLGETDKAKDYLHRALETNPYFSPAGVELARATLAEMGQRTVAQGETHVP
jgi:tetratricopeptide (TPR) repeat protein